MHTAKNKKHHSFDAIMRYSRILGFGNIHYRIDSATGLRSIIAIHSTKLGPAIGGCRFYPYERYTQALKDVLRLASMMTVKNAACGLAHGGGKAVIIKPKGNFDRHKLFNSFGDFVNDLNGSYITAMDVGTTNRDMDFIAERTPHVIGATRHDIVQEDPSPYTAKGIFLGIRAAVKFKYNSDSLQGMTVALQGIGKVGYHLAKHLHGLGAKIIACDVNEEAIEKLKSELDVTIVPPSEIFNVDCDIFSPCALGGTLTMDTVNKLRAKIIAGCANNQLAHSKVGRLLHERGVLYVPDFIVNAGGVIQAASVHDYHDIDIANRKIDKLYENLLTLFERAKTTNLPTVDVAYQIARENLLGQSQFQEVA